MEKGLVFEITVCSGAALQITLVVELDDPSSPRELFSD